MSETRSRPAKKPNPYSAHVEAAEHAAIEMGLSGEAKIRHCFDVAFVHALAGARQAAEDAVSAAEGEIKSYRLDLYPHQNHEFSLLRARVHAALGSR